MKLLFTIGFCIFFSTITLNSQTSAHYAGNRLMLKLKSDYQKFYFERNKSLVSNIQTAQNPLKAFDDLNKKFGIEKQTPIIIENKVPCIILQFAKEINIPEAIDIYKQTQLFEYVEPDYVGRGDGECAEQKPTELNKIPPPNAEPNDTYFAKQWGLSNKGNFSTTAVAGQDIKMSDAWNITKGSSEVVVCILDSGAPLDHSELAGRIWTNTKEIPGNGIDDDGNGFIDDVFGWNFADNNNNPYDNYGHGSNVTGIVGNNGNNNLGYAGMDWNCKLMIVKGLDATNSGFYSWWVSGIYYAVKNGAKVINMSLVGNDYSAALNDAVTFAWNSGVTVVACMGNDNVNLLRYPAGFHQSINVGSVDPNGKRTVPFFWSKTSGSNIGQHIDVTAPGNYIYGITYKSLSDYNYYWGGTSQATPHVTGLVSLMLSVDKTLTPTRIRDIIRTTADDQTTNSLEDTPGFDIYNGFGRINAPRALSSLLTDTKDISTALKIYPNPSNGNLNFHLDDILSGAADLSIYNTLGQIVFSEKINSSLSKKDFSIQTQFLKGLHFIKVSDNSKFYLKKIIFE